MLAFLFAALCSFDFWPKIIMRDQDMNSVNEFGKRAQSILGRSQPVALVEAHLQPARFKITPKKLRSVIPSILYSINAVISLKRSRFQIQRSKWRC